MEESIELVNVCDKKYSCGGEIFVPKIPSYKFWMLQKQLTQTQK